MIKRTTRIRKQISFGTGGPRNKQIQLRRNVEWKQVRRGWSHKGEREGQELKQQNVLSQHRVWSAQHFMLCTCTSNVRKTAVLLVFQRAQKQRICPVILLCFLFSHARAYLFSYIHMLDTLCAPSCFMDLRTSLPLLLFVSSYSGESES